MTRDLKDNSAQLRTHMPGQSYGIFSATSLPAWRVYGARGTPRTHTPSFRAKLVQVMKWDAVSNNIPTDVVNTPSLRAGGATSLFMAGIDWITIQRWGRWESCISHEYIWNDTRGFLHLGKKIAKTQGLTKYLVDVAPMHSGKDDIRLPLFHTGSCLDIRHIRLENHLCKYTCVDFGLTLKLCVRGLGTDLLQIDGRVVNFVTWVALLRLGETGSNFPSVYPECITS